MRHNRTHRTQKELCSSLLGDCCVLSRLLQFIRSYAAERHASVPAQERGNERIDVVPLASWRFFPNFMAARKLSGLTAWQFPSLFAALRLCVSFLAFHLGGVAVPPSNSAAGWSTRAPHQP